MISWLKSRLLAVTSLASLGAGHAGKRVVGEGAVGVSGRAAAPGVLAPYPSSFRALAWPGPGTPSQPPLRPSSMGSQPGPPPPPRGSAGLALGWPNLECSQDAGTPFSFLAQSPLCRWEGWGVCEQHPPQEAGTRVTPRHPPPGNRRQCPCGQLLVLEIGIKDAESRSRWSRSPGVFPPVACFRPCLPACPVPGDAGDAMCQAPSKDGPDWGGVEGLSGTPRPLSQGPPPRQA